LLVARPAPLPKGFSVVQGGAFSSIIRLGEGVASTGRLSEAAMARTFQALAVCAARLAKFNVHRSRLVATEACRLAANGTEFLERVREKLGLAFEILSPESEARLAVSGCASLIDVRGADLVLIFDIGGGSSELIWLDLRRRRGPWHGSLADRLEAQKWIMAWTSMPIGVVTLAERYGGRVVTPELFEAMVRHVLDFLEPFEARHRLRPQLQRRRAHYLGTSGTVTTLAGISMGLPRYDRDRVDGRWLATREVRRVTNDLLSRDYEQRVAEPCIGRERADLVLAGCAILEALLRLWPCGRLRVADRGLREGILASLMAEDAGLECEHPRHG
jgi:exopolyphosphatase/guanosine-5'-triphosphate,3'-diphosphate pyrophosphatase